MSDSATGEAALEHGEKQEFHQVNNNLNTDSDTEAVTARGVEADNIPSGYWYSYRFLGTFSSIVLLAASLFVNFNLPASAITVINEDLGSSPSYIWITDASTVVTCIGLLIVGRLSDIVGRRYFLIGGQVFGVVGSAICAKATSINMLIAGATIYGVATTTQLTFPFIVHEIVPNKHRGIAQAIITALVTPFAGFGAIIARELIEYSSFGWRWCYMINVIFNAVTLVLLLLCYFPPNLNQLHTKWTWKDELKKLDYGGILIFTAMSVLILVALNWGGSTYPWTDAHVLAPLIIGCVLAPVFALYETYVPLTQPILPVKLLKNRAYVAIVIVACIGQMAYFALAILWPEQISNLYTTDNITIGWMSLTSGLSLIVGEVIFGVLMKPLGHTRIQLIISTCTLFVFLAALGGTTHKNQNYAIVFTTMAGFFSGWLDIVTSVANGLVNEPGDLGLANGFLGSMKQLVGTIAVSIYVSILSNRFAVNFPKDVSEAALNAGLPESSLAATFAALTNGTAAALDAVPGMTPAIEAAVAQGTKTAWASTFTTVYYSSLAFTGVAVIAACFSSDIDKYMTSYVSRRIAGTQAMDVPAELTFKNGHLTDDDN
ncbi:siderophore iron transporter [Sporothrix brasiliensis 5110]|uniref:Siderophore iron transporter n=1 Tax=Sporothrix brasiliensis 5110 TaxID=1398154 RepID=A0A0C2IR40_9PEZI|nr:siderophore iron transporter [Sporothrix brasiliensis 5110]KIH87497.1 siderophore iron transporter [Sporothrix brasiliensis 5110]